MELKDYKKTHNEERQSCKSHKAKFNLILINITSLEIMEFINIKDYNISQTILSHNILLNMLSIPTTVYQESDKILEDDLYNFAHFWFLIVRMIRYSLNIIPKQAHY